MYTVKVETAFFFREFSTLNVYLFRIPLVVFNDHMLRIFHNIIISFRLPLNILEVIQVWCCYIVTVEACNIYRTIQVGKRDKINKTRRYEEKIIRKI